MRPQLRLADGLVGPEALHDPPFIFGAGQRGPPAVEPQERRLEDPARPQLVLEELPGLVGRGQVLLDRADLLIGRPEQPPAAPRLGAKQIAVARLGGVAPALLHQGDPRVERPHGRLEDPGGTRLGLDVSPGLGELDDAVLFEVGLPEEDEVLPALVPEVHGVVGEVLDDVAPSRGPKVEDAPRYGLDALHEVEPEVGVEGRGGDEVGLEARGARAAAQAPDLDVLGLGPAEPARLGALDPGAADHVLGQGLLLVLAELDEVFLPVEVGPPRLLPHPAPWPPGGAEAALGALDGLEVGVGRHGDVAHDRAPHVHPRRAPEAVVLDAPADLVPKLVVLEHSVAGAAADHGEHQDGAHGVRHVGQHHLPHVVWDRPGLARDLAGFRPGRARSGPLPLGPLVQLQRRRALLAIAHAGATARISRI